MRLAPEEARRRFARARVARLGSSYPDGRPHLVPVVFALQGERLLTAVDPKPKRGRRLQRLANLAAEPRVALLADHYEEDWSAVWWARAEGLARVVEEGAERDQAVAALRARYPQYAQLEGDFGAALIVDVRRWSGWAMGETLT